MRPIATACSTAIFTLTAAFLPFVGCGDRDVAPVSAAASAIAVRDKPTLGCDPVKYFCPDGTSVDATGSPPDCTPTKTEAEACADHQLPCAPVKYLCPDNTGVDVTGSPPDCTTKTEAEACAGHQLPTAPSDAGVPLIMTAA
jgi:hypothetical protein